MTPQVEHIGDCTLYCGDALAVLPTLSEASMQLICVDPPYYHIKSEAWDRQWPTREAYLSWLRSLAKEWQRILTPNGSLYVFASPQMAAHVEVMLGEMFHVLNRIQWLKKDGWHKKADPVALCSFLSAREEIIFAEHPSQSPEYEHSCNALRADVFQSIRDYLESERQRAGISFEDVRQIVGCAPKSGLPSHWFTPSQWVLPTQEQYAKLQHGFNSRNGHADYLRREYEDLRREYEDLRREYEDLRRPFTVSTRVPYTDVWDFATVPAAPGKHPCEKPLPLLRHIITASSRPGDTVLDCCAGSGSTLEAAKQCGRHAIGIEIDPRWHQQAMRRLSQEQLFTLAVENTP